jgi:uncharacterized protein (TIGR02300 family)
MPDLGQKHECFRCGQKFYDLKRSPVLCPKCGADQKEAPPRETSPERLLAARRAKRDEFADPDLFDRGREEDEVGMEPEDPATKIVSDEEELPLGEGPSLEAAASESEDDY